MERNSNHVCHTVEWSVGLESVQHNRRTRKIVGEEVICGGCNEALSQKWMMVTEIAHALRMYA